MDDTLDAWTLPIPCGHFVVSQLNDHQTYCFSTIAFLQMTKEGDAVNCVELVIIRLQENMHKRLEGTQHKELEIA
jgi:hypothetical protein